MRTTTLRRMIVGVAAMTTMLVALGAPAGADVGDVTTGLITFHPAGAPPTYSMPVPANPDPCSPPLDTGEIDFVTTGTSSNGTWTATTPTPISSIINLPFAGATRIDFTFLAASGTYSNTGAPPGYTYSLASTDPHLVIQATMYDISGSDCDNDPECTLVAQLVLTSDSGFDGTLPGAGGGETARFAATSDTTGGNPIVPGPGCSPPYNAPGGLDVTLVLDTTFP